MLDWSKSFETYLNLSENQRLGIGRKSYDILIREMENLVDEEFMRPLLLLMSVSPFISLREDAVENEFKFVKDVFALNVELERFKEIVTDSKGEKFPEFVQVYFQKVGGETLTALLSLALALLTIKGNIEDNEKELIAKVHG